MGSVINLKLRQWRKRHGLTLEAAAALIVVDGTPCPKATWFGWEAKGKVPKPPFMHAVCDLTGLEPNDFYPRADGRAHGGGSGNIPRRATNDEPPAQLALLA
jgi:hypothetical protein